MKKLKFSHEPIVWLGLAAAIVQFLYAYFSHQAITHVIIQPILTAIAAALGRGLVIPVANKE